MKTVSTKLDSKSHEYLIDLANKNGTTVSDVMRGMVGRLIQKEDVVDQTLSDGDRRREIGRLESDMDNLSRLLSQDISNEKRQQYLELNRKLEDKLSSLLDEEYNVLENSLVDILGQQSWFSNSEEFLDFVKRHDMPLLEALDDAMRYRLAHWNGTTHELDPSQISLESCAK
ncbi:MAG: hypothetical protein ACYDAJ_06860 [Nitrosotalea sp.]